nr:integrase, catalytic region, zinc finger, CCHC-type, peptidase aspartic, catalytic [Tanacetum cinerariifolium]
SSRPFASGSGGTSGRQRVIMCYNCKGKGHMAKQCTKPKRKRDAERFKDKVLLVQAQANGQVLQEEELDFLADPRMAESSTNQSVSNTESTSDSNIISYSKYMNESQYNIVQNSTLPALQDDLILSVIKQLKTQVVNCTKINQDNIQVNELLTAELERDTWSSQEGAPTFDELFEINNLQAQAQAKETVILKLKEKLNSLNGDVKDGNLKRDVEEIETLNIELDHKVTKLAVKNDHLKQTYKQLYDSIKSSSVRSKEQCDDLINKVNLKSAEVSDLNACLQEKVLVIQLDKLKGKVVLTEAVSLNPIDPELLKVDVAPLVPKLRRIFTLVGNVCPLTRIATPIIVPPRGPIPIVNSTDKPVVTLAVQIVLWYLDSGCSKHMTGDRSQLVNFVQKFFGMVKFGNDHVTKIMGYGDYQIGNVTISQVYYVEGLGHNLFFVGQFCDSDLEVAFCQHTCFIRNLDGVDLLTGSQGNNLYTLSIQDMMASSPICLLSKASKTKSWLSHRRLSHLNFGAINHLARQGLVRGLMRLKFEKDHLCSTCAMGKSTRKTHKPKSEDTNQEKLYLLHMDLCRPMCVESINGKKYILVVVDDYSRFTWVKFLEGNR